MVNKSISVKKPFLSGTGTSIIEAFLCSGRLPASNATLNSIAQKTKDHNPEDYVTFEKRIKGVEVTLKERILKIKSVKRDCTLEELSRFEKLGISNSWTDEQMGAIYYSLIEDEESKSKLYDNSYIKLRVDLLNIAFPKNESILIVNRMDNLRQVNFRTIDDYFREVENLVRVYSITNNLTKTETDRKLFEVFCKGLGKFTYVEVLKQNLALSDVFSTLNFLRKIEDGILLQVGLENLQVKTIQNTEQENQASTNSFVNAKKWCKLHKMKSHNTDECILNKNKLSSKKEKDESLKNVRNQSISKNFMISETRSNVSVDLEIEGFVRDIPVTFVLDDGSDHNYVSKKALAKIKSKLEDAKQISITFANNQKEIINKKIVENLIIQGKEFEVEFYVLPKLPVDFILGKEFLFNHNRKMDYGARRLVIGKDCTAKLKGCEKTLNEYNYSLTHQSGRENVIADQLSRCWQIKSTEKKTEYVNLVKWASKKTSSGIFLKDSRERIIIIKSRIVEFLQKVHEISGHRGISTMYYNLRNRIYIKNIMTHIKEVIKSRIICKRCKIFAYRKNKNNKITANERFERLSTDIYGPFKLSGYIKKKIALVR